jgi:serine/threonine-protein kinase RIM15
MAEQWDRDADSGLEHGTTAQQSAESSPIDTGAIGTVSSLLSPRNSSPQSFLQTKPTSINDFNIVKPISKSALGSVFLVEEKASGDLYAIKVVLKTDMIAKNQITKVKAKGTILMKQEKSPYVAKLCFMFQSAEHLYLVMEYLNGGDCAALVKSLGCLPERWTKNYIAEIVLGLEYLHQRGLCIGSLFISICKVQDIDL